MAPTTTCRRWRRWHDPATGGCPRDGHRRHHPGRGPAAAADAHALGAVRGRRSREHRLHRRGHGRDARRPDLSGGPALGGLPTTTTTIGTAIAASLIALFMLRRAPHRPAVGAGGRRARRGRGVRLGPRRLDPAPTARERLHRFRQRSGQPRPLHRRRHGHAGSAGVGVRPGGVGDDRRRGHRAEPHRSSRGARRCARVPGAGRAVPADGRLHRPGVDRFGDPAPPRAVRARRSIGPAEPDGRPRRLPPCARSWPGRRSRSRSCRWSPRRS